MTTTAPDLWPQLWPDLGPPDALARVEAIPLSSRGLPASTYELLLRAARAWPDRTATTVLPDAHPGAPARALHRSFAALRADVHRYAWVLLGFGIGRGVPVAVLAPNTADSVPVLLAAQATGIVQPVNPVLSRERVAAMLRLTGAPVLVAAGPELDPELWQRARELAEELHLPALLALRPVGAHRRPRLEPVPGTEVAFLDDLAADAPDTAPWSQGTPPPLGRDVASYVHTGGTTGAPRIAAHTHANEVADAWMVAATAALDRDAVVFAGLPLFHVNAIVTTVLTALYGGQRVVWAGPAGFRDPQLLASLWRLVETYGIAAMSAVPTVYAALTQVPVDADLASLRFAGVGAAPLPGAVRHAFEVHTGVPLLEGWGLTEATCTTTMSTPRVRRAGTVGRRLPYQQVRSDPSTGHLLVRGPTVFPGYVQAGPHGTRIEPPPEFAHGWLDTGDLGTVDDDGFVRLTGRAKDVIIRGGHNIDPRVIEDALLAHPDVTGAGAVGAPDPHAGEVPVAFVTLRPGAAVTRAELTGWAAERIGEPAATPRRVDVVPALPLTVLGKPDLVALRALAARVAGLGS